MSFIIKYFRMPSSFCFLYKILVHFSSYFSLFGNIENAASANFYRIKRISFCAIKCNHLLYRDKHLFKHHSVFSSLQISIKISEKNNNKYVWNIIVWLKHFHFFCLHCIGCNVTATTWWSSVNFFLFCRRKKFETVLVSEFWT